MWGVNMRTVTPVAADRKSNPVCWAYPSDEIHFDTAKAQPATMPAWLIHSLLRSPSGRFNTSEGSNGSSSLELCILSASVVSEALLSPSELFSMARH